MRHLVLHFNTQNTTRPTMRGYFTASRVFSRKKMTPRNKRTLNKIHHCPLTDPHRRHQVQWHTINLYTRETCAFQRKKNTHVLRANYRTSHFRFSYFTHYNTSTYYRQITIILAWWPRSTVCITTHHEQTTYRMTRFHIFDLKTAKERTI
jgi:hypothetical protein